MGKRFTAVLIISVVLLTSQAATAGYGFNLAKATRSSRLFNFETLDANLIWHATFFSENFRRVYEERYIERNHMNALEAAKFVGAEERRQSAGWEFFISFYTKKDYKKFTMEPDSFWKIHLTTADGEVVRPEEIEAIPVTPYEKVMFSHLNRWSKAYRVTFPKVSLGDEFALTIESVIGKSTVKWKDWGEKGAKRREKK